MVLLEEIEILRIREAIDYVTRQAKDSIIGIEIQRSTYEFPLNVRDKFRVELTIRKVPDGEYDECANAPCNKLQNG